MGTFYRNAFFYPSLKLLRRLFRDIQLQRPQQSSVRLTLRTCFLQIVGLELLAGYSDTQHLS